MILCGHPYSQYQAHKGAIDAAIARTLESQWYILGKEVAAFEEEFAGYCGASHAVGVANGTDAIALALRALDIGAGDEVIAPSHTAVATVAAIEQAGAVPILADIEAERFTLDPEGLEAALSPAVKAIVVVHLYGQMADMDPIMAFAKQHGLRVVEDCAQAHGALYRGRTAGTIGDAGCFSFFPTKNLGALGDGGAIITSDAAIEKKARLLRQYGWAEKAVSTLPGFNSRLDELQAAILRAKLPHLDHDNSARAGLAERYRSELANCDIALPEVADEVRHVYHQFVVQSAHRDSLLQHLRSNGVGAAQHYPHAVHQQPAYTGRLLRRGALTATERVIPRILSLPIYPELSDEQFETIISAMRSFAA